MAALALVLAAGAVVSRWWHDREPAAHGDGVTIVAASGDPARSTSARPAAATSAPAADSEPVRGGTDPQALYLLVREQPRDVAWAARAESRIAAHFADLPFLARDAVAVRCATTVCELTGTAAAGSPMEDVARAWPVLQSRFDAIAPGERLVPAGSTYGTGRSTHAFVLYFRRG